MDLGNLNLSITRISEISQHHLFSKSQRFSKPSHHKYGAKWSFDDDLSDVIWGKYWVDKNKILIVKLEEDSKENTFLMFEVKDLMGGFKDLI